MGDFENVVSSEQDLCQYNGKNVKCLVQLLFYE